MAKSLDDELAIVRELANVLVDTGLSEVEMERGDLKLRVSRQSSVAVEAAPMVHHMAAAPAAAPAPAVAAAPAAAAEAAPASAAAGDPVKSPMVGTCYLAPSPDADPFVTPGAKVSAGDTLMIVEAMKTMNAIKAPRSGTVVEILARNAEPVEFDETLLILGA
ncbi:MAG: acetyl-CoA carboxylase biotin carboxyl carrier protein [Pseudomonadota bacterium]